jgi:hypothetical protein
MPASAEDIGLSFAILSLVFAGAALIRRWSRPLRALFIPTAVIGGFLMLGLGPEGLGRVTGGNGLFSDTTFAVWRVLPGLLINVMCAALSLGGTAAAVQDDLATRRFARNHGRHHVGRTVRRRRHSRDVRARPRVRLH